MEAKHIRRTRREFLQAAVAVPAGLLLASAGEGLLRGLQPIVAAATPQVLQPTPACPDADEVTVPQTEGPFFKPRSPTRTSLLEPGMRGTRIILTGYVLSTDCKPVARALLDFWHADDAGTYDNVGFRLRGHQFTDSAGRYNLETVVPGLYTGRTRHFHVKVQPANQPILTTQLYFPGEPRNQTDGIFSPKLLMAMRETATRKVATFNFVLRLR